MLQWVIYMEKKVRGHLFNISMFFLSCVTSQSLEYVNVHNDDAKKVLKNRSQSYKTLRTFKMDFLIL